MKDVINNDISDKQIEQLYNSLKKDADDSGYILNPDLSFTFELVKGLLVNQKRYGYGACPCRLASGIEKDDLDLVCPCDYRDPDLNEYGACYCALYVNADIATGDKKLKHLPDRRYSELQKELNKQSEGAGNLAKLKYPVWRCKVCGYLAARNSPPEKCPICKVSKERFELFI